LLSSEDTHMGVFFICPVTSLLFRSAQAEYVSTWLGEPMTERPRAQRPESRMCFAQSSKKMIRWLDMIRVYLRRVRQMHGRL